MDTPSYILIVLSSTIFHFIVGIYINKFQYCSCLFLVVALKLTLDSRIPEDVPCEDETLVAEVPRTWFQTGSQEEVSMVNDFGSYKVSSIL